MSPKKRPRLHRLSQRSLMDHAIRPLKSVGSSSFALELFTRIETNYFCAIFSCCRFQITLEVYNQTLPLSPALSYRSRPSCPPDVPKSFYQRQHTRESSFIK